MKKSSFMFLACFGLFWTALVGSFDVSIGTNIVRQLISSSFSSTTGEITHSELTQSNGDDGIVYGVDIRYHYNVAGQSFEGQRFRYDAGILSFEPAWAQKALAQFPVESHAVVFYDPHNPGDALLSPGVIGSDLMAVLFSTPFNMVMLGFWQAAYVWVTWRIFSKVAGGVNIQSEGPRTLVRLPASRPLMLGMIVTGVLSFVAMFVVGFSTGFHPPVMVGWTCLIVAYSAGASVYLWQWWKIHSGIPI